MTTEIEKKIIDNNHRFQLDCLRNIKNYSADLSGEDQKAAEEIINDYLVMGKTNSFIFNAFRHLHGRRIADSRYLMFNRSFMEEVRDKTLLDLAEQIIVAVSNKWLDNYDLKLLGQYISLNGIGEMSSGFPERGTGNQNNSARASTLNINIQLNQLHESDIAIIDNIIYEAILNHN